MLSIFPSITLLMGYSMLTSRFSFVFLTLNGNGDGDGNGNGNGSRHGHVVG